MPEGFRLVRVKRFAESASTALTIVSCLLVCTFVFSEMRDKRQRAAAAPRLEPGTVLSPPGNTRYSDFEMTLLVGLSSKCRYCEESLPALRRVDGYIDSTDGYRLQTVALGLEPPEVLSQYVESSGLQGFQSVTLDRNSELAVLVSRTPSFALVDRRGVVLTYWTGRTSIEVMDKIVSGAIKKQRSTRATSN